MRNEIRYAIRALSRDRAFAAMVVLSLAVGIGANTAIFSLVNGVLLHPPAYRDPDRLVAIDLIVPKLAKLYPALPVNLGILLEWRKQATSLESIGVMQPTSVNLTGAGEPELLAGARVSANIFTVLGVQPRLGRSFMEGEDPAGHDRVAILADSLWRRRFHSDPAIVGREILLNDSRHEVVGVLPPSFRFPVGPGFAALSAAGRTEVFRPLGYQNDDLQLRMGDLNYWVTARLRPGVSISKARAELNVVLAGISARLPDNLDFHASNDAPRAAFFRRVLDKAAAMPGVQSVALVSALPLQGETWIDIVGTEHDPRPLLEKPTTNVRFISPGYFQTLRIPLRDGRDFQEQDQQRKVAIISAGLAQRLWPGQNPIGRNLDHGEKELLEVVGITPDIRSTSLDHDPVNMMYQPYWQRARSNGSLLVRTAMDPRGIAAALRSAIWAIDSEVPIPEVRTLEQVMAHSVAQRRFQTLLVVLFAAAALALAAFGTYGVVSYAVARRRAEMGIRMALGAKRSDVLKMVLRQGMMPVLAGLAAGAILALAIGRSVASLLFQVSPRDPLAFTAASAVLLLVSVAACLIPARRATRVNPTDALRFE
jgi:hypothetical protein